MWSKSSAEAVEIQCWAKSQVSYVGTHSAKKQAATRRTGPGVHVWFLCAISCTRGTSLYNIPKGGNTHSLLVFYPYKQKTN